MKGAEKISTRDGAVHLFTVPAGCSVKMLDHGRFIVACPDKPPELYEVVSLLPVEIKVTPLLV